MTRGEHDTAAAGVSGAASDRGWRCRSRVRGGFTLLELLAAVVVILILVGIIVFAAPAIFTSQERTQTESVLASLDRALQEYESVEGGLPPFTDTIIQSYRDVFDASGDDSLEPGPFTGGVPVLPDAWLFLSVAEGFGAVDEAIANVPSRFARTSVIDVNGTDTPVRQFIDAWGNPIIYVHPGNQFAQDLFGRCPNGRPYFMSGGPDGAYGFVSELTARPAGVNDAHDAAIELMDDNLYSVQPSGIRVDASRSLRITN